MAFAIDDLASVIYHVAADSITGLSDGDNVSAWADSSSSSADMTATAGQYPIWKTAQINSLPAVRFDGVSSKMTSLISLPTTGVANPGIVAVMKIASNKNYNGLLTLDTVSPATDYNKLSFWAASAGQVYLYGSARFQGTTTTPLAWFVYDSIHGLQSIASSHNGAIQGVFALGVKLVADLKPTLGLWPFSGSNFGAFDLAELVVFNETTLAERIHITGSLAHKYGITLNADHPFFAAAPTTQPGAAGGGLMKIGQGGGYNA
jgi:hypothetical protein